MAHAVRLNNLTEELVELITGYNSTDNAKAFKACKDGTTRSLRSYRYGRTNHYSVKNSLNGLIEKFQILNREPLADAVNERLNELAHKSNKWTPDILSLLLHLSDRPIENVLVDDLDVFSAPESPAPLTWEEIVADDPLEDGSLWDDVEYDAVSSEDDFNLGSIDDSQDTESTTFSDQTETHNLNDASDFIVKTDPKILAEVGHARLLKDEASKRVRLMGLARGRVLLPEAQAVRDVLDMLNGRPTLLFACEDQTIRGLKKHCIQDVSVSAFDSVLRDFAYIGTPLQRLRNWCFLQQSQPLLQTFQAATIKRLRSFEDYITCHLNYFVAPKKSATVSLLALLSTTQTQTRMLLELQILINSIDHTLRSKPYTLLEVLFAGTCDAQAAGDEEAFIYLASLFLDSLQTYLKPVRRWMQIGELDSQDEHFPVCVLDEGTEPAIFWRERYSLRNNENSETLHAPNFLTTAIMSRVLASGKSVAFLKELGLDAQLLKIQANVINEPPLVLESILALSSTLDERAQSLGAFSACFRQTLDDWITSKHYQVSSILKHRLLHDLGLGRTLLALQTIFLSKNGAVFNSFASCLFAGLDIEKRGKNWDQTMFLQDMVHTTFGEDEDIQIAALAVLALPLFTSDSHDKKIDKSYSVIAGISGQLIYYYPAPVQNIVPTSSLQTYQAVMALLLQVRRPKQVLESYFPRLRFGQLSLTAWKELGSVLILRHRFLNVLATVEEHLVQSAIAVSCRELNAELDAAVDVDELIEAHSRFLSRLRFRALVGENREVRNLRKALVGVCDLALLFGEVWALEKSPDTDACEENDQLGVAGPILKGTADQKATDQHLKESKVVRFKQIHGQMCHLVGLLITGLRNACRTDAGDVSWEMLSQRLESDCRGA